MPHLPPLSRFVLSLALTLGLSANALALSGAPVEPPAPQKSAPLPALSANPDTLTVSGLSSGAFMAVQFHVAHSAEIKGAGVLAGGPYYCALGMVARATTACMNMPSAAPLMAKESIDEARRQGEAQTIDNPEHLKNSRVWLWSGGKDNTVNARVVNETEVFYRHWLPATNLTHEQVNDAGHAIVTPEAVDGNACDKTASPYLNRCGQYDAPGKMLAFLFDKPLLPKAEKLSAQVQAFDQSEFFPKDHDDFLGLADTGYVYIPAACQQGGCDLHVAFHGCKQNFATIGDKFITEAGYNAWADSNRLIVLYPQTRQIPNNPNSCWDWWGYSSYRYHVKDAPQIEAIQAMIERLTSR